MSDNSSKWYHQPSVGTVLQRKRTGRDDRMGLYDSEEGAHAVTEKITERNKTIDDRDERDDDRGAAEK